MIYALGKRAGFCPSRAQSDDHPFPFRGFYDGYVQAPICCWCAVHRPCAGTPYLRHCEEFVFICYSVCFVHSSVTISPGRSILRLFARKTHPQATSFSCLPRMPTAVKRKACRITKSTGFIQPHPVCLPTVVASFPCCGIWCSTTCCNLFLLFFCFLLFS